MDRKKARDYIKVNVDCRQFLEKSKYGNYCCPFCGSGTGPNGTGALKYNEKANNVFCFSCQQAGDHARDVFDIYQKINDVDYNTALKDLAEYAGITIDTENYSFPENPAEAFKENIQQNNTQERQNEPQSDETPTSDKLPAEEGKARDRGAQDFTGALSETKPDYTRYYYRCSAQLNDPRAVSYLKARGLSLKVAQCCGIGFDPQADLANCPGGVGVLKHPCPRIIIPTSDSQYIGRRIDGIKDYAKMNSKDGKVGIFNKRALFAPDVQEVFVTEGAFDALSIMEAGAAAIALNSTNNAARLIELLEENPTTATLILCCDNDDAGKKANETLRDGLQRLNVSHITATAEICGEHKDANEALQADRSKFEESIKAVKHKATKKPDNVADYISQFMGDDIERFKQDVKTGFPNLDEKSGGLYAGLYTVAAISSLGKTTFCAQLADQLAEAGQDVIFFSLEQSRLELVSKSIARLTAQKDPAQAVDSLQIRKGRGGKIAREAAREYVQKVGDRLSVVEGNFNCNISFIGDYVRQYIRENKARPIVFIDYLQVLQPEETNGRTRSTKETVDTAVTALKRLSREMNLTIFIISSVNRANYLTPIDFESLKESGGIEYTCDVVWGLQFACLNEDLFSKDKKLKEKRERVNQAKNETPRKIELRCLKNRYGRANFSCSFDYFPRNDLFKDTGAAADFMPIDNDDSGIDWGPLI
jgi:replicative DNA helicase